MLRASALVERLGLPAVSIVTDAFVGIARAIADAEGIPGHPLAVMPHVIMTETIESIRTTAREVLVDQIVAGLALSSDVVHAHQAPTTSTIDPAAIVTTGSLEELFDDFEDRGWSDGLPFVPPTPDRVAAFLRHTSRAADELLGVLPPAHGMATVWNTAVNGVMAGCRPEYMPLLLAIVEAIADPTFRLQDGGSTPGWEPLVIVNGPVVREFGFNCSTGAMRVGRRSNSTVGRFVRLVMRNIAGIRMPPGQTDKGTIGMPTNVALAEDEGAVRDIGWPTFAEERGFTGDDSVVTVQSIVSMSPPVYSAGTNPLDHARTLAEVIGSHWSCKAWDGLYFGQLHPLLVLSPSIARAFSSGGWDKDAIRRYFKEHVFVTAESMQRYAWQASGIAIDLHKMVAGGQIEPVYADGTDPDRLVPALRDNAQIGIIVAGDAGRNQSRGYVQQHRQGPPTSRVVQRT